MRALYEFVETYLGDSQPELILSAVERYNFDAYGNLLNFGNTTPLTSYLYSGEAFDFNINQQYLRARWYDAANGRFNRLDPFAGNSSDPQSFHKYAYVHGDPIQGIDPTGLFAEVLALQTANAVILLEGLIAVTAALLTYQLVTNTRLLHLQLPNLSIPTIQTIMSSGYAESLVAAIADAAILTGETVEKLSRLAPFPIFQSRTPEIFDFTVQALLVNPRWVALDYHANQATTDANRNIALRGIPTIPGKQRDEFPYASTLQGGFLAWVRHVDADENRIQGGDLSFFYGAALRYRPGKFFVFPVPELFF